MSKQGFMIFAHNNEQHDYLKQAIFAADRVSAYMDLPVTIVTDKQSLGDIVTDYNVILTDAEAKGKRKMDRENDESSATWYNSNRNDAYELSPYEQTIIIDSDYLVCSAELESLFRVDVDFLCYRNVFDLTNRGSFDGNNTFGQFKMPHFWATVIYFKKGKFAENIFNDIAMVKKYWKFFGELYKFNTTLYRNDYAVSIALLIAYGHRQDAVKCIPWRLLTVGTDVAIEITKDRSGIQISYETTNADGRSRPRSSLISGRDVHILNKYSLEKEIDRIVYKSI